MMSHGSFTAVVTVVAIGYLAPVPAAGQNQASTEADGVSTCGSCQ